MNVIRKILRTIVAAAIISGIVLFCTAIILTDPDVKIDGLPEFDAAPLERIAETREIYDADGTIVCKIGGNGRLYADYSELDQKTPYAFLSIEDSRFYEHGAVDFRRIIKAAATDIAVGSAKEGASTITQQLVKNTYLSPEKTIMRKIKEIRLARAVEKTLNKNEILGLYLNSLYFGNNIYGIETAARRYFGKTASELSVGESALLAAIINNPGKYDPISHPEAAESRRKLVVRRMRELGYIDDAEYENAVLPVCPVSTRINCNVFYGYVEKESNADRIYTSLDRNIQSIAEAALSGFENSEFVTKVVVVDRDGKLIAAASNTFSDIAGLKRSPGSTIKPLICYAPALENKLITPVTPLLDAQTDFDGYAPKNYPNKFHGWITADKALSLSLNVPAVKLLDMNGIDKAKTFCRRLGLDFSDSDNGLALALGGMTDGVDLLTLCRAYSAISAGGKNIMSKETAYLLTSMLQKCAENGTAKALGGLGVAAKTGTVGSSVGNTDAYCIAYNDKYTVGVWCGATEGLLPSEITGGELPTRICAEIFKHSALKSGAFRKPNTVVTVEIDGVELEKNHRVVAASSSTMPKDRVQAEFSIYNMPGRNVGEDLSFGKYENFDVVDSFTY